MTIWIHAAVVSTTLAATAAIAIAGASSVSQRSAAEKADRLAAAPITAGCTLAERTGTVGCPQDRFVTVERRADGVSVLTRIPVAR